MTRVNLVDPSLLTDQHLRAEWHELPRVFTLAKAWHARGMPGELPETFRLGPGPPNCSATSCRFTRTRRCHFTGCTSDGSRT